MIDAFFQNIIAKFPEMLLHQIIALGFIFITAWILRVLLHRLLGRLEDQYVQIPLTRHFLIVTQQILFPLLIRVLSELAIIIFQERNWSHTFLTWTTILIGLWLFYNLLDALLNLNLTPSRAKV